MSRWEIYLRDDTLARTGMLEFRQLTCNLRFVRGSRFEIVAHQDEAADVERGDGLLLVRDGATVLSGMVVVKGRERDGAADEVVLQGVDDLERIGWRIIYPDPTLTADGAQPAYDVRTGDAETVIRDYVRLNAAADALNSGSEDRRIPGLAVAINGNLGTTVTGRGRWQPLVEYCATLAERGGVGFRARQQLGTDEITFEVYAPQDRPGVRFDVDATRSSGSLKGYGYELAIPEVTWAIAGGRGQLEARTIRQDSDGVDAWGRIERFLDQNNAGDEDDPGSEADELDAAIADTLREGQGAIDMDLEPVDTEAVRWGRDYSLGDRVKVRIDGETVWRQVREVEVTVDAQGERVGPKLGDASRRRLRRLLARIGELERKTEQRGRG